MYKIVYREFGEMGLYFEHESDAAEFVSNAKMVDPENATQYYYRKIIRK